MGLTLYLYDVCSVSIELFIIFKHTLSRMCFFLCLLYVALSVMCVVVYHAAVCSEEYSEDHYDPSRHAGRAEPVPSR